jgi:hypothetical protein
VTTSFKSDAVDSAIHFGHADDLGNLSARDPLFLRSMISQPKLFA